MIDQKKQFITTVRSRLNALVISFIVFAIFYVFFIFLNGLVVAKELSSALKPSILFYMDFLLDYMFGTQMPQFILNALHLDILHYREAMLPKNLDYIMQGSVYVNALFSLSFAYLLYDPKVLHKEVLSGRILRDVTDKEAQKELEKDFGNTEISLSSGLFFKDARLKQHCLLFGGTGSGKTAGYFKPFVEQITKNLEGTKLIIHDMKGDFTSYLDEEFTLFAPWDKRSAAWNIARDCRTKEDAQAVAKAFIDNSNAGDKMWANGAREILVGFLVKLQTEKPDKWDFADLHEIMTRSTEEWKEIVLKYNPVIAGTLQDPESKQAQSFEINLISYLPFLEQLAYAWSDAKEDRELLSIKDFLHDDNTEDHILILQNNKEFETLVQAVYPAILELMTNYLNSPAFDESNKRRIYFLLDELAQLGKIESIGTILEVGRSKGLRAVLGLQTLDQLYNLYGQENANSWIGMVNTKLICSTNGQQTMQTLSDTIGKAELRVHNYQENAANFESKGETREEVYTVPPHYFNTQLGPHDGGVDSIALFSGLDNGLYKVTQPFIQTENKREPVIMADWTTPETQREFYTKQAKRMEDKINDGTGKKTAGKNEKAKARQEAKEKSKELKQSVEEINKKTVTTRKKPKSTGGDSKKKYLPPE